MSSELLFQTPQVISRQGEALFVKCPLYKSKNPVRPIYINKELFGQYISTKENTWEEMSQIISDTFSVTLERDASSGEQRGWAYVDRQADPLNISLSGNGGSGRAYYTGSVFNIKGEKTPLATSTDINHANGVLAMSDGIWCTLVANSLYPELKVSPVLAIVNLNEIYVHPETEKEVSRVKIIRLDIQGSLDRISHLFYLKKPENREYFLAMARNFGQLEGDKFLHRILHGSWSNGNISPAGHLIDYDSVCAVKGRQPQFSASSYYIDNYFSFEYQGKLKVLDSLINDKEINIDGVTVDTLRNELLVSRNNRIVSKFTSLMGFNCDDVYQQYYAELSQLTEKLLSLSRAIRYISECSFYTNTPLHFFSHLFDFSNFFRFYPLLKLNKQFTLDAGFVLLAQSELIVEEDEIEVLGNYFHEPLEERVLPYLQDCFVREEYQLQHLKEEAYDFIKKYDELFEKIAKKDECYLTAIRAYLINEDRFYLFPVFDLSATIAAKAQASSSDEINSILQELISANQRTSAFSSLKSYRADIRIFKEGISYIELKDNGTCQIVFALNNELINNKMASWSINFNGNWYDASASEVNSTYMINSSAISIKELLVPVSRDEVFKLRKYELYCQGNKFQLQDYYAIDQNLQYYL
jgi:hypothetical protein